MVQPGLSLLHTLLVPAVMLKCTHNIPEHDVHTKVPTVMSV